eukprot:gene14284-15771_t
MSPAVAHNSVDHMWIKYLFIKERGSLQNLKPCIQIAFNRASWPRHGVEIVSSSSVRSSRGSYYECVNQLDDRSCDYFATYGFCATRKGLMEKNCRKACNLCVKVDCSKTRYGCCLDGKTAANGPHMQGCKDDCRDVLGRKICKALKRQEECLKPHRVDFMKHNCAITCGYCRPCIDKDPFDCQIAARYGGCSVNLALITERCRKSCNFCGSKDPCYNHACPKHSVCKVRNDGKPVCECHGRCHKGDHFTGVVCGRDGVEYKNLCQLKKRNCNHPTIKPVTVHRFGACQTSGWTPDVKNKVCTSKKADPSLCKKWTAVGYCKTRKRSMRTICPKSCNFCRTSTAPEPVCHHSKYGCCLDNRTPCKDTHYKGCPKYPHMTNIIMAGKSFTDDAIQRVFLLAPDITKVRTVETRGSYFECVDKLDKRSCHYLASLGAFDPPCNISKYGCCFDGKTLARGPHMQGCSAVFDRYSNNGKGSRQTWLKTIAKMLLVKHFVVFSKEMANVMKLDYRFAERPCVDEEPYRCLMASKYNRCSSGKKSFLDVCRRTCGICGKKDPCHDFACPQNSVCRIDDIGKPYCECDGHCRPGDHFTGVVCGRDDTEYKSLCALKKRNCGRPETPPVTVRNYGPCERGVAFSDRRKVCEKRRPVPKLCIKWEADGYCTTRRNSMRKVCPQSCNFCAVQFPRASCRYSKHGCCLDNRTPCLNTSYKGCPKLPACKDFAKVFCRRFTAVCGTKLHKATMRRYCPKACHLCGTS